MRSIRRTLLLWLYAGLSLGIAAAAAVLYFQARAETNRILDFQMQQLAWSLPGQPFAPITPERRTLPALPEGAILIQIWDRNGVRIYYSHERMILSPLLPLGFSDVETPDGPWRVFGLARSGVLVQVAQPLAARGQLAADTALWTVAPLFLLFPFLGILIWLTVSAGLAPVQRVAREVQSRDAATLAPIESADLPDEIKPLAGALNDLLARLRQSIGAQRAFIADAAHELRTPLTALQLQIQLAERAQTPAERAQAFGELKQGYMRAMNMVQQLLTLARQEPDAAEMRREPVALRALAQQAVADHAALAEERGIDLGIAEAAEVSVAGDPDALRILLGNLVSNALRYTPRGGRVDVHVVKDGHDTVLAVQDTGPGIPEQDLARVFDRFYRVPGTAEVGSGLGLAIAKQIAEAHGALLTLGNTHPGLRAELRWKG